MKYDRRRRRLGRSWNHNRFARLEPLESRVLLDGTGSLFDSADTLGNNNANDQAWIFTLDVVANDRASSDFYQLRVEQGALQSITTGDLDYADLDVYYGDELALGYETVSETWSLTVDNTIEFSFEMGDQVVVTEGLTGSLVSSDAAIEIVRGASVLGQVKVAIPAGDSSLEGNFRLTLDPADSDPVDDRLATIEIGQLPADMLPADNAPFADTDLGPAPAKVGSVMTIARAADTPLPSDVIKPAQAETTVSETALSSDQYFAHYSRRDSVALTTHTDVAQTRRHVADAANPAIHQTRAEGSATLISAHLDGQAELVSALVGLRTVGTTSGRLGLVAAPPSAAELNPVAAPAGEMGSVDVIHSPVQGLEDADSDLLAISRYRRIGDLARSIYQPVSLLVGISLVSAHLNAPSPANRKRRFRIGRIK